MFYLKNPRKGLRSASICVFFINGKELANISVEWSWSTSCESLGYAFNGLTAAKRYFGKEYQSVKHGFEKPIWEQESLTTPQGDKN